MDPLESIPVSNSKTTSQKFPLETEKPEKVNLNVKEIIPCSLPTLYLNGIFDTNKHPILYNNGTTVKVELESDGYIRGGPLFGRFLFEELHFHWQTNDDEMNYDRRFKGKRYPLEAHFVFSQELHSDVDDEPEVVVLCLFFKINQKVCLDGNILREFEKPLTEDQYYTYTARLSVNEIEEATWIIKPNPVPLRESQFEYMKSIDAKQSVSWNAAEDLSEKKIFFTEGATDVESEAYLFRRRTPTFNFSSVAYKSYLSCSDY